MQKLTEFPEDVRTIENTFVTLGSGLRLAARIWMPKSAETKPVPAILEYLPYRKRDLTRARDQINHPYLAGHGYACVRVDMRGSGDSDGVLLDEYTEEEMSDGEEVIDWISRQPWCNGRVGMMGISWGGFNALQLAARRPPALHAIVSCCASDDQYEDNMHYMGGCLLGDHLSEATVMFAFNSLPPDPEIVGARWRDMWFERLQGSGLWLKNWLDHQHRDAFWKKGSVREDYSRIQCPVMLVGGWVDGYTNAVFRLLEHLEVPRQGLIGPWGHRYPHVGVPGPAVGFLQEVLDWFDRFLKDKPARSAREPMLRMWLQDSVPPSTAYETRPGRWIGLTEWPSPAVEQRTLHLAYRRLLDAEAAATADHRLESISSPLSVGLFAGKWCSYSALPDLPYDQREEDGGALVFDTLPVEETVDIVGSPVVELEIAADKPVAQVAVRLSDVWPDGQATRVTYGLLNLTHRESREDPSPLEPGRFYRVRVRLNGLAQRIPKDHRLRLSISSSYFPLAWAPPEPVRLTLRTENCQLLLPQLCPQPDELRLPEAEGAPPLQVDNILPGEHSWRVVRDIKDDLSTLEVTNDQGMFRIPEIDLAVTRKTEEWYSFRARDFSSLEGETMTDRRFARDDWQVGVKTRTRLRCDAERFYIHATLDAFERDRRIFSNNWDVSIRRMLV